MFRLVCFFSFLFLFSCERESLRESDSTSEPSPFLPLSLELKNDQEVELPIEEVRVDMNAIAYVDLRDLAEKGNEDLFFLEGNSAPYTGGAEEKYPDGGSKTRFSILNGKRHGPSLQWYENGKLWKKSCFREGKLHGSYEWWYENGRKAQQSSYRNGLETGTFTKWYEDGKRSETGSFRNGKEDGPWLYFNEDGTVWDRIVYVEGELLEEVFE